MFSIVDGTESDENFYSLCTGDVIDVLNKSLTFEGVNGRPRIGCRAWNSDDNIATFGNTESLDFTLWFKNLVFENGALTFHNSAVEFENVSFHNASIRSDPDQVCYYCFLNIFKLNFKIISF